MLQQHDNPGFRIHFVVRLVAANTLFLMGLFHLETSRLLFFLSGLTGFSLAELGAFLATDYYSFRRHRGLARAPKTLTAGFNPPQLVLKGAWGAYLLAFLPALLTAIALENRGWVMMLVVLPHLFLGYYFGAPPLFWGRTKTGAWISPLSSTFLPLLAGSWAANQMAGSIAFSAALALYVAISILNLKVRKYLAPELSAAA